MKNALIRKSRKRRQLLCSCLYLFYSAYFALLCALLSNQAVVVAKSITIDEPNYKEHEDDLNAVTKLEMPQVLPVPFSETDHVHESTDKNMLAMKQRKRKKYSHQKRMGNSMSGSRHKKKKGKTRRRDQNKRQISSAHDGSNNSAQRQARSLFVLQQYTRRRMMGRVSMQRQMKVSLFPSMFRGWPWQRNRRMGGRRGQWMSSGPPRRRFRRDWGRNEDTDRGGSGVVSVGSRPVETRAPHSITVVESRPATPAPSPGFERPINRAADAPLALIIDGKLHYGQYANQESNARDNLIPDFSYAGYMGGGVALPTYDSIPVQRTLSPSGGDDFASIQQALDEVANLPPDIRGIKGAVLLARGTYSISRTLRMTSSGVILRGEGQGPADTVISSTNQEKKGYGIRIEGEGGSDHPRRASNAQTFRTTDNVVPTGSRTVTVASVADFIVGDKVALVRTPNDVWIGPDGINVEQFGWEADNYNAAYEASILAIDEPNNQLILDVPLVETIETRFGGGEIYRIDTTNRIQQTGIENIRVETPDGDPDDYDRPFWAIYMQYVENSWVRDVTVRRISQGITTNFGVRFVTVQDSAYLDPDFEVTGGNHYAFNLDSGQGVLMQRCFASQARHPYVTGSKVRGPNVFLDSVSVRDETDTGPHQVSFVKLHKMLRSKVNVQLIRNLEGSQYICMLTLQRWSTGTLYDNLSGTDLWVQNRADSGTGHGWAGAQQMLWNVDYETLILHAPGGAMNWAVGAKGEYTESIWSPNEPNGIIESQGQDVQPRSLYLQQLQDRLGAGAVNAITIPLQRSQSIIGQLRTWDGNGRSPLSASNFE
jgi:hypothetical protein